MQAIAHNATQILNFDESTCHFARLVALSEGLSDNRVDSGVRDAFDGARCVDKGARAIVGKNVDVSIDAIPNDCVRSLGVELESQRRGITSTLQFTNHQSFAIDSRNRWLGDQKDFGKNKRGLQYLTGKPSLQNVVQVPSACLHR